MIMTKKLTLKRTKKFKTEQEMTAFKEFLSESGEWHALWMGFYSAFYKGNREYLPDYLKKDIENEYHYYTFGFFLGRVVQTILVLSGIDLALLSG